MSSRASPVISEPGLGEGSEFDSGCQPPPEHVNRPESGKSFVFTCVHSIPLVFVSAGLSVRLSHLTFDRR